MQEQEQQTFDFESFDLVFYDCFGKTHWVGLSGHIFNQLKRTKFPSIGKLRKRTLYVDAEYVSLNVITLEGQGKNSNRERMKRCVDRLDMRYYRERRQQGIKELTAPELELYDLVERICDPDTVAMLSLESEGCTDV